MLDESAPGLEVDGRAAGDGAGCDWRGSLAWIAGTCASEYVRFGGLIEDVLWEGAWD
jgi:hypothetical protein